MNIFKFILTSMIACWSYSISANTQAVNTDSLKQTLGKVKDTEKLNLLKQLYTAFWLDDMQQYHNYIKQALELSTKLQFNRGVMEASYSMGLYYMMDGKPDSAIYWHKRSLDLAEKTGPEKYIYMNYLGIGDNLKRKGKNTEAMELIQKSLKYFEEIPGNDSLLLRCLVYSAEVYFSHPNGFEKALEMAERHFEISKQMNDSTQIATSMEMFGVIYGRNGDFSKALGYFIPRLQICRRHCRTLQLAAAKSHVGTCYLQTGEHAKGIQFLKEALEAFRKSTDKRQIINIYEELGLHHINQEQFDAGFKNLHLALDNALESQLAESVRDNYKYLSNAYEAFGNTKKALEYHKLYHEMGDSITRQSNQYKIAELLTQFETEKKEKKISFLQQEKEIQALALSKRNNQLVGLGLGLILLSALGLLYFRWNKLKHKNQKVEMLQKQSDIEQKALRSQMNPHFIFNALASINNYILKNKIDASSEYLTRFAGLMRQILEHSREEMISLRQEIEALDNYLSLERLRFNMHFDYLINVHEGTDPEVITVPPMLIQPFVENSIKHGFSKLQAKGLIEITFKLTGNILHCQITDNGIGIEKTKAVKIGDETGQKSLGMEIVNERTRIFKNRYGVSIEIEASPVLDNSERVKGTKVELEIPQVAMD